MRWSGTAAWLWEGEWDGIALGGHGREEENGGKHEMEVTSKLTDATNGIRDDFAVEELYQYGDQR